jgi:hypothetical protein
MSQRPDPPPVGAALTAALADSGLSARQAARQAGISEGRWRQISGGYQVVRPGVYAPVRGPAATVARMAAVAGLNAAQLRAAGREDAARALEARATRGQVLELRDELLERISSLDCDQARELLVQLAGQLSATAAAGGRGDIAS